MCSRKGHFGQSVENPFLAVEKAGQAAAGLFLKGEELAGWQFETNLEVI